MRFLEAVAVSFKGNECLIWPYARAGRGYGRVWRDGRLHYVHRIVCEHAHGPAPSLGHEAAHSCGKGHLGCVNPNHLRWATYAENRDDMILHGTYSRGERNGHAKLTEADVHEIRRLQGTMLQREIGAVFGIAQPTVSLIHRREKWGWLD